MLGSPRAALGKIYGQEGVPRVKRFCAQPHVFTGDSEFLHGPCSAHPSAPGNRERYE